MWFLILYFVHPYLRRFTILIAISLLFTLEATTLHGKTSWNREIGRARLYRYSINGNWKWKLEMEKKMILGTYWGDWLFGCFAFITVIPSQKPTCAPINSAMFKRIGSYSNHHFSGTWRIIQLSKWLIFMVSKCPSWGCSPSKSRKWFINGVWDDPPSRMVGLKQFEDAFDPPILEEINQIWHMFRLWNHPKNYSVPPETNMSPEKGQF